MYTHLLFAFMAEETFHGRRKLDYKIRWGGRGIDHVLETLIDEGVNLERQERLVSTGL